MLEIINGILSSAVMTVSIYFYGYTLFKEKNTKSNNELCNIIAIIISIMLYAIVFLYFNNIIKTILLCIVVTLTFKYVFNELVK